MHTFVALSFLLGASALHVARDTCSFQLTASGGESGTIGQLSDGQNRIGGGPSDATFTISNGGITDAAGRGCILTPSVEQFQCDEGVGPTFGFTIDSNDTLEFEGSSVFFACPASETEWNIYTTPVTGQLKCVEVSLTASGCGAVCSASVVTVTTTVTVSDCTTAPSTALGELTTSIVIPSSQNTLTPTEVSTSTFTSVIPTSTSSSSIIVVGEGSTVTSETTFSSTQTSTAESTSVLRTESTSSIIMIATTSSSTVESTSSLPTTFITTTASPSSVIVVSTTSIPLTTFSTITGPSVSSLSTSSLFFPNTTISTSTIPQTSESLTTSASTIPQTSTSSVSSSSTCVPTILSGSSTAGNYQYPHLIVPISSLSSDTAEGTQFFGTINSTISTIFNFDIPSSYSGSTCSLVFLLPLLSELETSSYTFSGTGGVDFEQLSSAATTSTTFDNAPSVSSDLGTFILTEGSSTLVETFACPAGTTVTFELKAVGDTSLVFFQDYNPSPLGLYITEC